MTFFSPKQTLSMQTRDGVRLDADVYYPKHQGKFPVLLMRQPYGRAIASTVVYAHPSWYADQGYIVVIQDVRGRGTSEGEFELFVNEIEDGFDTVEWAAHLPRSTGQVGMYGFSYQGMTQLYAAIDRPPALKALAPAMVGYDLYHDWAYEGGAFCYQLNLGWAMQLAAETARRKANQEAYQTLYAAARNPPLHDPVCPLSGILRQLAPESHYHDWLSHPDPNDYYWQMSPHHQMQAVDLPMLHIGGWFDTYLRGTVRLYKAMAARSQFPQHLMVAPWAHLPWGRKTGSIDYGAEAQNKIDRLQIQWFDYFLKGRGSLEEMPVSLFEMGTNQWCKFSQFPATFPQIYALSSTGLAAMGEGSLTTQPSSSSAPPDLLIHDSWRPVPSLGGHAAMPAGSFDRAAIDCRTDVLTYTSAPLETDLHIAGEAIVQIYCTADAPSFDLCATLSEVKPNGSVFGFSQGYLRIPQSSALPESHLISLQPTCMCIAAGNSLRLSLSAACFPAYAMNPGTGTQPIDSQLIDAQVITITVYSDGDRPSHILLPIEEIKS